MAKFWAEKDAGRVAVSLAMYYFGVRAMARSTPTGAHGTEKLDENVMMQIMEHVLSKFGGRRSSEVKADIWSRRKTAIAQKFESQT